MTCLTINMTSSMGITNCIYCSVRSEEVYVFSNNGHPVRGDDVVKFRGGWVTLVHEHRLLYLVYLNVNVLTCDFDI